VFHISGDVCESEPSDAETIDSESSDDECDNSDVSASETEQTEEPDEDVVSESLKENISSECVTAVCEVINSELYSPISQIIGVGCTTEHSQKIHLSPNNQHLKQQVAGSSRLSAINVLESYAVSAQLANVGRNSTSLEGAVQQTSADYTVSVAASTESFSRHLFKKPTAVSLATECGSSIVGRSQLQRSMAQINDAGLTASAARSVKPRRVVPTSCEIVGTSASVTQEPADKVQHESREKLMNGTFTLARTGANVSELSRVSSRSSVDSHRNSTYSITAAGQDTSKNSTVIDISKHHRSIDLKPSLGKSVVIADLSPSMANKKQLFGTITPTRQRELIQTSNKPRQLLGSNSSHLPLTDQMGVVCSQRQSLTSQLASIQLFGTITPTRQRELIQTSNKPRQLLGRDSSHLPLTDQMGVVCSQRQSLTSQLASMQHQAKKKAGSALLQGPVVTAAYAMSANVGDPSATESRCRRDCWNSAYHNHPTAAKPLSLEVFTSTRRHLPDCCTSVTKEGIVTGVVNVDPPPMLPEVPGSVKMVKNGPVSDCHKLNITSCGHRTPVMSHQFKVSDCKDHRSDLVGIFGKDGNNNDGENESVFGVGLGSMSTENNSIVQKLPKSRFRGFATSTPLRDSSPPPPPDMSFCSMSSISLVSDLEYYDTTEDTDDNIESEDEVILLDVAFVSDSLPESPRSATSPNPVTSKPQLSCNTGGSASQKSSRRSSQLASTINLSTSQSCRFSGPQHGVKSKRPELPNGVVSVVSSVRNKRTRRELSSSSSSDSEDPTSTKQNSRTPRNTRARFSQTIESGIVCDTSYCLGPTLCTKAICFRCHCN